MLVAYIIACSQIYGCVNMETVERYPNRGECNVVAASLVHKVGDALPVQYGPWSIVVGCRPPTQLKKNGTPA